MSDYAESARLVSARFRKAEERIATTTLPRTESEWIESLHELHASVFEGVLDESHLGFRERDVFFGHGVLHGRQGSAPECIRSDLEACFRERLTTSELDAITNEHSLCRWGAQFLRAFFAIHPFEDGNGRIARLIVDRVAQERLGVTLAPMGNSSDRKWYRNALEFAHRYHESDGEKRRVWWKPLARWMGRHLIELVYDEADPPTQT